MFLETCACRLPRSSPSSRPGAACISPDIEERTTMPETAAARRTGLCNKEGSPVPLAGVSVEAEITVLCARVVVTQRYVNREASPIEAVYVFPLDEGAAVHGF